MGNTGLSPYCLRCTANHRGVPHNNHETKDHNRWWWKNFKKK